mgnify:CR=1 FL=1
MKTINIQDIDKYPDDYNWLSSEEQIKILGYMRGMQDLCERYYRKYFEETEEKDLRLYQHTLTGLTGAKNAYATLGIMVEKWGNNGEWILATKIDAETYNNEDDSSAEEVIEQINSLLDYTDVGQ